VISVIIVVVLVAVVDGVTYGYIVLEKYNFLFQKRKEKTKKIDGDKNKATSKWKLN